jgi:hypothetical protein
MTWVRLDSIGRSLRVFSSQGEPQQGLEDWLTYALESDQLIVSLQDGYLLHWEYPCRTSASVAFGQRRHLINHLRTTVMQDLRVDAVMQRDARHALTTGDRSLIAKTTEEHQPPPSPEALAAHRVHSALAKRQFRRRADLELKRAAALSREMCTTSVSDQYGRRIAIEIARHITNLLKHTLEGAGVPRPGSGCDLRPRPVTKQ